MVEVYQSHKVRSKYCTPSDRYGYGIINGYIFIPIRKDDF